MKLHFSQSSLTKEINLRLDSGKTLKGIIADWSDTQMNSLKLAIGKANADKVVKGCQVQYMYFFIQC